MEIMEINLTKVDDIIVKAMASYIRTSKSGGMPTNLANKIMASVSDAARLNYFSIALTDNTLSNSLINDPHVQQSLNSENEYAGQKLKANNE